MGTLLLLSTAMLVLIQQHVLFTQMCQRQSFLSAEAPKIGALLVRLLNNADAYSVYPDKQSALASASPTLESGTAVRLIFKSAAQANQVSILSLEPSTTGSALKIDTSLPDGSSSSWTITKKITSATFLNADGILNMTLHGPQGEEITYSGGAR